ncbi:MAG: hypothetical protein M3Q68_09920 [Actinomycetota bacterium]|nr:hypothetical protein [Actinomycetota bacterium]
MAGRSDDVAFASNWKSVLAADALLGIACLVISAVVAVNGNAVVALLPGALGVGYLILVARRARRWKRLRATPPRRG